MGLATTNRLFRIGYHLNGIGRVRVAWRDGSRRFECRVCVCSRPVSIPATQYMGMASQLRFCQRRGFHSAGHTRSCPPQPAPATGLGGPHDVRQRIIRGQGIGAARCTGKRMCVGLGAASIVCPANCIWLPPFSRVMPAPTLRPLHHIVRMAGQLLDREGGFAHSAGQSAG